MKAKKEGRELPEVTVNQFTEGKGWKTHFEWFLGQDWGSILEQFLSCFHRNLS